MAPKPATLTLKRRIEQELAGLDVRATELRIALKVVAEFDPDAAVEEPTNGSEAKRIILKPTDDLPDAVKSRLSERTGASLTDRTLDLERS